MGCRRSLLVQDNVFCRLLLFLSFCTLSSVSFDKVVPSLLVVCFVEGILEFLRPFTYTNVLDTLTFLRYSLLVMGYCTFDSPDLPRQVGISTAAFYVDSGNTNWLGATGSFYSGSMRQFQPTARL